jgi:hypothetical protein
MKVPPKAKIEPAPCDTCKRKLTCQRECLVFEHWVETGIVLKNLFKQLCR